MLLGIGQVGRCSLIVHSSFTELMFPRPGAACGRPSDGPPCRRSAAADPAGAATQAPFALGGQA